MQIHRQRTDERRGRKDRIFYLGMIMEIGKLRDSSYEYKWKGNIIYPGAVGARSKKRDLPWRRLDKSKSRRVSVPSAYERALCYKAIVEIAQETVSNNGANNLKAMLDSDFSLSPFACARVSWLFAEWQWLREWSGSVLLLIPQAVVFCGELPSKILSLPLPLIASPVVGFLAHSPTPAAAKI